MTSINYLFNLIYLFQDIQLGFKPVVMINGNEPAIEAFRLMEKRGISSVAVVDNDRKLVAVVSTADLKVFSHLPPLPLWPYPFPSLLFPSRSTSPLLSSRSLEEPAMVDNDRKLVPNYLNVFGHLPPSLSIYLLSHLSHSLSTDGWAPR